MVRVFVLLKSARDFLHIIIILLSFGKKRECRMKIRHSQYFYKNECSYLFFSMRFA